MPSARKPSRKTREWQSDQEYIKDQDENSTWSSVDTAWGNAAASKFVDFGDLLEKEGRLCHDDKVADFGGNDGWAAFCFYHRHKIKPLVVDCEPKRLDHADKVYKLPTYLAFIEDMKDLRDKSIDWGFTSHTMEHMREPEKAFREIARVVKRGCCFVVPLEDLHHARKNHAHAICFTKVEDWVALMEANGWRVTSQNKAHQYEAHILAEPT
jgi:ubiquinone/menaquinone biosynthesis C-methylase UbiE